MSPKCVLSKLILVLFLFEDICLKETMSLADSLYNLQLIQEFCQEYLNQCCHFTLEDMLYAASSIKVLPGPLRFKVVGKTHSQVQRQSSCVKLTKLTVISVTVAG